MQVEEKFVGLSVPEFKRALEKAIHALGPRNLCIHLGGVLWEMGRSRPITRSAQFDGRPLGGKHAFDKVLRWRSGEQENKFVAQKKRGGSSIQTWKNLHTAGVRNEIRI